MEDVLIKLNELMIKQSLKDKTEGRIECISKVKAFQSLIELLKEEIRNSEQFLEEKN